MQTDIHALTIPYSHQSVARVPACDAVIWRFMSLAKFLSMLYNRALHFAVLSSLNDVLEAAPPRLPDDATVHDRMRAWYRWQRNRHMVFVNCWHVSQSESAAMWALYATQSEGVAIRSTFGEASKAFGLREAGLLGSTVQAGMVEYIDPEAELVPEPTSNVVLAALKKRHWYAYESELRFMYIKTENYLRPPTGSQCEPGAAAQNGLWIQCDLQKLIKSVVLAPSAPAFLGDVVAEACRQSRLDPSVQQRSRLREGAPEPPDEREWKEYLRDLGKKYRRPFGITL
ncbi:MAG: hypothetical protein ABSH49_07295 [Bryobacteraceae bacterium]